METPGYRRFIAAVPSQHRISVAELSDLHFVVSAAGVLDDDGAIELGEAVLPLAAVQGAHVVADLVGATFVDVSSVALMGRAADILSSTGGRLVVVTRDPRIRTQLTLDGSTVLVESSLGDAVEVVA